MEVVLSEKTFYQDGLQFSCTGCHDCCRHDPGYVFLTEDDVEKILDHLSITLEDFLNKYCRIENIGPFKRVSLIEKENYDCIFWNQGCTIYEARPLQCRAYPFWANILGDRDSWNAEGNSCPGINQGKLHSREDIEKWLQSRIENPLIEID